MVGGVGKWVVWVSEWVRVSESGSEKASPWVSECAGERVGGWVSS